MRIDEKIESYLTEEDDLTYYKVTISYVIGTPNDKAKNSHIEYLKKDLKGTQIPDYKVELSEITEREYNKFEAYKK